MTASPWFTEDEKRAWTPFVVSALHLLATLDGELKASVGLSHLDYGMMMLLSQASDRKERMSTLAAAFGADPSVITYRVRRLEARGLVTRIGSPTDGRITYAHLTDEGLRLLRRAQRIHVRGARRHFLDHLTSTQMGNIETIFSGILSQQKHSTDVSDVAYVEHAIHSDASPDE